jgi:predicted RNA-binding protein with TRAM domain
MWLPRQFVAFNRVSEPFESPQGCFEGSGYGGREITSYTMPGEQAPNRWQGLVVVIHYVRPGGAVNMKIDETRHDHAVAEISYRNSSGNRPDAPGGNFEKASLLDEHQRMLNGVGWSQ